MRMCPFCSAVGAPGARFCVSCGADLDPGLDEVYARARGKALAERRERWIGDLRWWLAAGTLFFIAALVFRCNNLDRNLPRFVETPAIEVPPPPFAAQELLDTPWIVLPLPAEKQAVGK